MPDDRTQFVVIIRTGQLIQFDWTINALDEANIPHLDSEETVGGLVTAPVFPSTGPGTWWSVAVPEHLVEQAKEVLSALPGEITTQPDVWDFRPKPGVKTGWKIFIVASLLAPFLFFLLFLLPGGASRQPDAAYWLNAGVTHHRLKDYRSAVGCYDEALRLDFDALQGRAYSLVQINLPKEAIAAYTQAIAVAPESPEAYDGRGYAHQLLGEWEAAAIDYEKALRIKPSLGSSLYGLAEFSFQKRAYMDAWHFVHEARKARTRIPPDFLEKLSKAMPEPPEEFTLPPRTR